MNVHFPSVAVGVAGLSIILLSMSQATGPVSSIRVEYGPQPRDMVQVREGTPYVVPQGRLFVLTGLGKTELGGAVYTMLKVNGVPEAHATAGQTGANHTSILPIPTGFTVGAGATIEADDGDVNGTRGRAWGYLGNP